MNFEKLLYVQTLAQQQSLQKAADTLHITKSGLSLAISQLEDELNIQLFTRNARGSHLTEAGRQLLAPISDILKAKNQLEVISNQLTEQNVTPKITISYMNTFLSPFITSFIDEYQQSYKNTELDISCHELGSIMHHLHRQKIDAGFIAIRQQDTKSLENLTFTPVCETKLSLICDYNNPLAQLNRPITFEDLKQQKFSLFNDPFHDSLFESIQLQCGPLQQILRVDDANAMITAIKSLNTVCFIRKFQSSLSFQPNFGDLKTIEIGHLIDDHFILGWLTNPNRSLTTTTQNLIQTITKKIQKASD